MGSSLYAAYSTVSVLVIHLRVVEDEAIGKEQYRH